MSHHEPSAQEMAERTMEALESIADALHEYLATMAAEKVAAQAAEERARVDFLRGLERGRLATEVSE